MFGRKKQGTAGEIDVTNMTILEGANEFLRMWSHKDGPVTCLITPGALGPDPFLFGMALMDGVRHAAKAYSQAIAIAEDRAFCRVLEGFDAERLHPTDVALQISGKVN